MSNRSFSFTPPRLKTGESQPFASSAKRFLALNKKSLDFLAQNAEEFLKQIWVPRTSNIQFQVNDILFHAAYEPEGDKIKLQIWSILGYLPFSVESLKRRRILINILNSTFALTSAKFGINRQSQIIVMQTSVVSSVKPPQFIFVPLVSFLQEALPYIRLIGECL